jgi:hypothetical protein
MMRIPRVLAALPLALIGLLHVLHGASVNTQPQAGATRQPPIPSRQPPAASRTVFTDVTARAGIQFRHNSGAFGKKYLPETMGSGVVVFDADGDGWQDLFFVNSTNWPGRQGRPSPSAFYRNNRNGTFSDVSQRAKLSLVTYGLGGAAADYDNDGDADLFVTALGGNRLFRNDGKGVFDDVTKNAGVGYSGFSTSAAWFDYDKDGALDLYVTNYVQWSLDKDLYCTLDGKTKSYCTPESYKGLSPILYRNRRNGTFEDVTKRAGLEDPTAKALGIALVDYNADGWTDLFVANDTQPNLLYKNNGNGTFTDEAVVAGVAFNEAGVARAGMGTDAADYDGSGRESLIIGNFANEMMALYHNEGTGLFIDEAPASTIGQKTLLSLTFACFFFDYDLDGTPDIFGANGHVADDINRVQPKVTHAQPANLFRNLGGKRFLDVSSQVGPALQRPVVARGAAYVDYDLDGDLDIVETINNGPARLLRNDRSNPNNSIRVSVEGRRTNRPGIGAKVVATLGGRKVSDVVRTGSSYLSQSELPVTLGIGSVTEVTDLEVRWPDGRVERVSKLPANHMLTIVEGQGIASRAALPGRAAALSTRQLP